METQSHPCPLDSYRKIQVCVCVSMGVDVMLSVFVKARVRVWELSSEDVRVCAHVIGCM